MTQEFPAGVVTTTDKVPLALQGLEDVDVDDIARLWKVFTTQRSVVSDGAAPRLENLFWRIWGNQSVQGTLSGSTLAKLFMAISECSSLHMTPGQSPQKASPPGPPQRVTDEAAPKNPSSSSQAIKTPSSSTLTIDTSRNAESLSSSHKAPPRSPLPPILKRPSSEKRRKTPSEPSSLKTARILLPDQPSQRPRKTSSPTSEAQPKPVTTPTGDAAQKQGRKKTAFAANTPVSTRRRAVLMRRKSSQSPGVELPEEAAFPFAELNVPGSKKPEANEASAPNKPNPTDSEFSNVPPLSWQSLPYLRLSQEKDRSETTSVGTSRSSPPAAGFSVSSVHRHRSAEGPPSTEQGSRPSESATALVDRDFRTHFVARRQNESVGGASSALSSAHPSASNLRDLIAATESNTDGQVRRDSRSLSPVKSRTNPRLPPAGLASPVPKPRKVAAAGGKNDLTSTPRFPDSSDRSIPAPVLSTSASTSITSQQTSSGIFSVPKAAGKNNNLTALVERSKSKGQTRASKT